MHLWLTTAQAKAIVDHARTQSPNEACGIIGGKGGQAVEVIPIDNAADHPTTNYVFEPAQQAAAMSRLYRDKLDLTALYHSHPNTTPIPSQTDIRDAAYTDTIYLIVGLQQEHSELAAWQIGYGEVQRVPLYISDTQPDIQTATLTTPQKVAVILAGIIAAVAMIAYSIYLLPPAPPIPTPGG